MVAATLRISVVLHHQPASGVLRLARSLAHSVRLARADGLVGPALLRFGDCGSDAPSLRAADLDGLRAELGDDLAVELTAFDANLGHGGGQNALAADLTEDLLLVINPDTVAEPLLVTRLVERFSDPRVGVVEARQLPVEHPKEHAADGTTPWASMACAMLRAAAVREVGLFDAETFFLHGDDVDLSWRMRLAGWAVVHEPRARVFHDKQIGEEGYIAPSAAERVQGPLGTLLLAWKWSLDDELEPLRGQLLGGTADQQEAVRLFDERRAEGRLPERLDGEGRVASFVAGNPGRHRF
jgi:hypothetical protein